MCTSLLCEFSDSLSLRLLCVGLCMCVSVNRPLHQTCQNLFVNSRCHGNSMTVASSPRSNRHWWGKYAILWRCQHTCCLLTLWNNHSVVVKSCWHAVTFKINARLSHVLFGLKLRQSGDRKWSKSCSLSFLVWHKPVQRQMTPGAQKEQRQK